MRACLSILKASAWVMVIIALNSPRCGADDTTTAKETTPFGESTGAEPPANVERPTTPPTPPDALELNVRPDADGLVAFSFKGQPWPAVLEWLADISHQSLEWQQAPPGFLDLTTRGSYSVAEVRDLINSVLLTRGFTLLNNDDVLMVVELKQLDVSLVPRVTPDELDDRGRHELVRTFFDLDRLRADTVAEEFKPLLSPYGQIAALATTNRLDALETAGNLRRIRDLLSDEQKASRQQYDVREFRLKHARSAETLETLKTLLGVKSSGTPLQLTPEQQQQIVQQLQQSQQQGAPSAKLPPRGDEIYLANNERENSILAHAPVDKLAVIEQAISYLDVAAKSGEDSLAAELPRVQRYELAGIAPESVVKVLRSMGTLDPTARIEVDAANRALIVQAPLVDHITVRAVIDKLDVGGRKLEVIQLHRANVDYVASSLEFLFRGVEGEKPSAATKPQYAADRRNNRLFLWANEAEMADVRRLLVKLDEPLNAAPVKQTTETINLPAGKQTDELLRKLRELWPSVSPNPLLFEDGVQSPAPAPVGEPAVSPSPEPLAAETRCDETEQLVAAASADQPPASEAAAPTTPAIAPAIPPINIQLGSEGLVATSEDPAALDRLRKLVEQLAAPEARLRVFSLHNGNASDVATLLQTAYAKPQTTTTAAAKPPVASPFRWPGFEDLESADPSAEHDAFPVRFFADPLTNTVLVQGADDRQLAEIERLIEVYDRVQPPETQPTRKPQIVRIEYGSAEEIGDLVKDVYRDLLSPDDPAILRNLPPDQRRMPYNSRASDRSHANRPNYRGLLSLGVNEELNALVISAPEEIAAEVSELVQVLDHDSLARRPVAKVRAVKGIVNDPMLRAILNNAVDPESTVSISAEGQAAGNGSEARRRSRDRSR